MRDLVDGTKTSINSGTFLMILIAHRAAYNEKKKQIANKDKNTSAKRTDKRTFEINKVTFFLI